MTTYSAIADSDIDPESPITTGLMTKLRDNPLAIQQNDATAPDVVGASWVKIDEKTASASSLIAFTGLDSTYATYIVVGERVVLSASTSIGMQISDDNGSTYKSGATYYDETPSSGASIVITDGSGAYTYAKHFWVTLFDIGVSTWPMFRVSSTEAGSAHPYRQDQSWLYDAQITINAIKFFPGSGTITSGTFKLYGLRCV